MKEKKKKTRNITNLIIQKFCGIPIYEKIKNECLEFKNKEFINEVENLLVELSKWKCVQFQFIVHKHLWKGYPRLLNYL